MFTLEAVLDRLEPFDIDESTVRTWQQELGLIIPMNPEGQKQYSPHHINLFKNIRKHLALGRTLDEVRNLIQLPPEQSSRPQIKPITRVGNSGEVGKPYASVPIPQSAVLSKGQTAPRTGSMLSIIETLNAEKEQLHRKLMETEKLNSHLYNANNLFHKKMKTLTDTVGDLREELKENQNFKLLDEKSQLQKQLISSEKVRQTAQKDAGRFRLEWEKSQENYQEMEMILDCRVQELQQQVKQSSHALLEATSAFNPRHFCNDWREEATLLDVEYDNFGINIEANRERVFRISEVPTQAFGNTAVITTQYEYETNALWKRIETLIVTYMPSHQMQGQLISEYIIDGVPVAKATYNVVCNRHSN